MDNLPIITANYAAILTLMYMVLTINVVRARMKNRISLQDGNILDLREKIRIHGNFSEYVPLALILISFVELANTSPWIVHILCSGLLIGRLLHAFGLKAHKGGTKGRRLGMYFTAASMGGSAIWILLNLSQRLY